MAAATEALTIFLLVGAAALLQLGTATRDRTETVVVDRREGHDVHTVMKAVTQGRSSQFAFCRQAGICIGRVLVCPSYCFSAVQAGRAAPAEAAGVRTQDYDGDDYNYYYYYGYDERGGAGSPGSPGTAAGGGAGGQGGGGGGAGGSGGSGGGFGGGSGGGNSGFGGGSGTGNSGFGSGGGFGNAPNGPVARGRSGSNGAVGAGNGCRYDCLTSCRAFCS